MANTPQSVSDFETIDPAHAADPTTFSLDVIKNGAVFVIPIDAPLPSELGAIEIPKGDLYERIRALASADDGGFHFLPLSGMELNHLERAWRLLQKAKRIYVLMELPAARYDILFTQAARQIGLASIEWPAIAETIAAKAITDQRTRDKTPWISAAEERAGAMMKGGSHLTSRFGRKIEPASEVELPSAPEDDDDHS